MSEIPKTFTHIFIQCVDLDLEVFRIKAWKSWLPQPTTRRSMLIWALKTITRPAVKDSKEWVATSVIFRPMHLRCWASRKSSSKRRVDHLRSKSLRQSTILRTTTLPISKKTPSRAGRPKSISSWAKWLPLAFNRICAYQTMNQIMNLMKKKNILSDPPPFSTSTYSPKRVATGAVVPSPVQASSLSCIKKS